MADIAAGGLHAAVAVLAALVGRATTGEGAHLDVAVADGVLVDACRSTSTSTSPPASEPGPGHYVLTGRYACYDVYPAGDGGWLAVAAIEPKFWANLCRLLGLERWIEHQTDDDAQDDIRADFRAAFAARARDEWVAVLADADTCVAPVLTIAEVVDDPQFAARGAVVRATHPTGRRSASWARCWPGRPAGRPSPCPTRRSPTPTSSWPPPAWAPTRSTPCRGGVIA